MFGALSSTLLLLHARAFASPLPKKEAVSKAEKPGLNVAHRLRIVV
jgi:hypothetical protein